mmetsp:Transcript_27676/g.12884  ORF Transcript_27676/g.12884 Transcript_27676/m.12884 type:complete len:95 (-) Transcript_27676:129-413(-)
MNDRLRAVRQEFCQQKQISKEYIQCHEKIARFHLIANNEGLRHPDFDLYMNVEQLSATLTSLRNAYQAKLMQSNEPEFFGYILLMNLNNKVETE